MSDGPVAISGILQDHEHLRARVRSDRRETSMPLLTLGVLAGLSMLVTPQLGGALLAVPAVLSLVGLAWYYQRREASVGVGTSPRRWSTAGLVVLVAYVLVPSLAMLFLPPVAIVGVVVAVVGVQQRNRALVLAGVGTAIVSLLEGWFVISNRAWDIAQLVGAGPTTWWVASSGVLVSGILSAVLLVSGLVTLQRERSRG